MADNDKKDIGTLLSKYGYSLPLSEEEIISFEEKFKSNYQSPNTWNSVDEIISGNFTRIKMLSFNSDSENSSTYPLSMAAREGKSISDEIRKKNERG